MNARYKIAVYLLAFIIVADQMSKWWILSQINMVPGRVEPITSFFNIVLVHNRGVTFGLLNSLDHQWVTYALIAVATIVVVLLGRWLMRTSFLSVTIALGSIMGGAIGNVIDRVRFGSVVDFLDFYYRDYHWPAFNLADSAIVVGVGLLLLDSMVRAK